MATDTLLNMKVKVDSAELQELITSAKKASEEIKKTWSDANNDELQKYKEYINAKNTLNSKDKVSFEEYEKAKTVIEQIENDNRLKSYVEYKNKEDEKNKQSFENAKKLGNKLSLTLTTPLIAIAGLSLKSASKIEDFTASFKTLLGTEPKAKAMIKTINEMASATPFDPAPLIQSTEKLLAFGIEAENVDSVLHMLGDSSKGSAEALQTLSTAYGKVAAKGKASMEELNMMIDRGVPILGELAKVMGVNEDEIISMVSSGKIGFNELNQAFVNMTSEGGVFYKGMETASQTLSGKLSTLKGNISLLGASLMEEVLPVVKNLVDFANNAVVAWQKMGDGGKTAILAIGSGLAVLGPSLKVITGVSTGIINLAKGLKTATTAQAAFNLVCKANPYVLLASGIIAVGTALAVAISRTDTYKQNLEKTKTALDGIKKSSTEYLEALQEIQKAQNNNEKIVAYAQSEENLKKLKKEYTDLASKLEKLSRQRYDSAEKDAEYQLAYAEKEKIIFDLVKQMILLGMEEYDIHRRIQEIVSETNSSIRDTNNITEKIRLANEEIIRDKEKELDLAEAKKKAEEEEAKRAKEQAEAEKDGFQKAYDAYNTYMQNKDKLDSELLSQSEREELQAEQNKLQNLAKKYETYLEVKKNTEEKARRKQLKEEQEKDKIILLSNAKRILDLLKQEEQYSEETTANAQKKAEIEKQLTDLRADELKELLTSMAIENKLTDDLVEVYNKLYEVKVKENKETTKELTLFDKLNIVANAYSEAISSISTNFEALSDSANNILSADLANTVGIIGQSFLNIVGSMSDMQEEYDGLDESQSKFVNTCKGLEAGFQALGQVVSSVSQVLNNQFKATTEAIEKDLDDLLQKIDDFEDEEVKKAEEATKARLEALKEEYAQRGIIIETGYETELEKAQEAYNKAREIYENYRIENEDSINQELELYKLALADKTDEEIQSALKAKELELSKTENTKQEEAKRTMLETKAELEKQTILKKSEDEKTRIAWEAECARVEAENKATKEKYKAETSAFYANVASQIAQVWINFAAGTVAAWASCMPLGPIAGPIAAAVLTTALASVAGVQTGTIASQPPPQEPTYQPLPTLPAFAEGVTDFKGGLALVGEQGPEIVNLPTGANVLTNENTNSILQSLSNQNGDIVVNVACYVDSSEIPIKKQLIEIQRAERYRSR